MRHLRSLKRYNYQFTVLYDNNMNGMRTYEVGTVLTLQDAEIMCCEQSLKDSTIF